MDVTEKILLVQLLLEDIRGNWGWEKRNRAIKAKALCEEIANEMNDDNFKILANQCSYIMVEMVDFLEIHFHMVMKE